MLAPAVMTLQYKAEGTGEGAAQLTDG